MADRIVPQESDDVLATHHAEGVAVLEDHDVLGPDRGPRRSGLSRDPMQRQETHDTTVTFHQKTALPM
jgi:hypothetical protein